MREPEHARPSMRLGIEHTILCSLNAILQSLRRQGYSYSLPRFARVGNGTGVTAVSRPHVAPRQLAGPPRALLDPCAAA